MTFLLKVVKMPVVFYSYHAVCCLVAKKCRSIFKHFLRNLWQDLRTSGLLFSLGCEIRKPYSPTKYLVPPTKIVRVSNNFFHYFITIQFRLICDGILSYRVWIWTHMSRTQHSGYYNFIISWDKYFNEKNGLCILQKIFYFF